MQVVGVRFEEHVGARLVELVLDVPVNADEERRGVDLVLLEDGDAVVEEAVLAVVEGEDD